MRDFVTFAAENYQKDESKNALVKAINVMLFKAEGQAMLRHPEFKLEDRLLFDKIDPVKGIATLPDGQYEMNTTDFPTYDPDRPYEYSPEEEKIIEDWQWDFLHSEALQKHMDFFFSHGSLYKVMNGNLMFHGGLPMNEDGTFRPVRAGPTWTGWIIWPVSASGGVSWKIRTSSGSCGSIPIPR